MGESHVPTPCTVPTIRVHPDSGNGSGRSPRRIVVASGLAVVVVVAAILLLVYARGGLGWGANDGEETSGDSQGVVGDARAADSDEVVEGGPLETHANGGYFIPNAPGRSDTSDREFTDAFEVLKLSGEVPARLLAVESIGPSGGLVLFDAQLSGPDRDDNFQYFGTYPPKSQRLGTIEPLAGTDIEPFNRTDGRGHTLLLGYRITAGEPTSRAGLNITYEVAGQTFRRFLPTRLIYCGELKVRQCDAYSEGLYPDG